MDDLWSFVKDGLKAGANVTTILQFVGAGGATVAAMGAFPVPRVGAGRAVGLFFRSKVFGARQKPRAWSQRLNEVAALQRIMSRMMPGEYTTLLGGKGVGKTALIQTALRGWGGVICVTISPGMKQDDIVNKYVSCNNTRQPRSRFTLFFFTCRVLKELTRIHTSWFDPLNSARRVLFCYNLFNKPPIVHLELSERNEDNNFAEITGATRYLAALGLRLLLDASPNSLAAEALTTERQVRRPTRSICFYFHTTH
jgi:hypothetical protein